MILDTIGVCIRGSETDYIRSVADGLVPLGRGPLNESGASVFATGDRRDISQAATLNAAAGTTLELDEGNQRSAHLGIHTVTPALAIAEQFDASRREFFDAVLAGYEVGARLGDVVRPMESGLHPHGAWAPVASAVAAGRLQNVDSNIMADAIRNAVTPFIVGHWKAALEGATIRNFYTGLSCQHGIMAVVLARQGINGVYGAIEECFLPYTAGNSVSEELLRPFETFGEEFYISSSYIKIHAACRYTHAPIEAIAAIQDRVDFTPERISKIEVRTFELGTMLDQRRPDSVLAAKFSTPFAVASKLCTGRSDVDAFTQESVEDEQIQEISELVSVLADSRFEANAEEGKWGAEVSVRLTDGSTHTETVRDARGGGKNSFTRQEVYEKFDSLVSSKFDEETSIELRNRIMNSGETKTVNDMIQPIVSAF